jgi:hypothetical protein
MIFSFIILVLIVYSSFGAVFALFFLIAGVSRIDESARGASVWFRFIIFPGVVAFWPLLLYKWIKAGRA